MKRAPTKGKPIMTKDNRWLLWGVPPILLLLLLSWFFILRRETVLVVPVQRGLAVESVFATGVVEPSVMVPISPVTTSRLMELLADEGDEVTEGQLLARLDDRDAAALLLEERARVGLAELRSRRAERLVKSKAMSVDEAEQLETELQVAEARLKSLEAKIDNFRIIAPKSGRIVRRDGEVGEVLQVAKPLFWLAASNTFRITAEVDEEDRPRLQIGQEVLLQTDGYPAQEFHGTLSEITPKGNSDTRSYRVRVELKDDQSDKIGMTMEANIITQKKDNTLLIPTTSISNGGVWHLEGSALKFQPVIVGISGGEKSEVLKGLEIGDLIALSPEAKLLESGRYKIQHFSDSP